MMDLTKTNDDIFWSKVKTPDAMSCWEWQAYSAQGYGKFAMSPLRSPTGKMACVFAHRYAYESINGPIPENMVIDHLCSNKLCCNPVHLQVVTIAENTRRYYRGRSACPKGHVFTPDNSGVGSKGERICRKCCNINQKAYAARKKENPA